MGTAHQGLVMFTICGTVKCYIWTLKLFQSLFICFEGEIIFFFSFIGLTILNTWRLASHSFYGKGDSIFGDWKKSLRCQDCLSLMLSDWANSPHFPPSHISEKPSFANFTTGYNIGNAQFKFSSIREKSLTLKNTANKIRA